MWILRKIAVLIVVLFPLVFTKCESDTRAGCEFAMCTEEFRGISIHIMHQTDSTAFNLTSYSAIRISDGKDITISDNILPDNKGYYSVANDMRKDLFRNKNVEVEFSGYLNDKLVLQKRVVITADCCHISLVKGETTCYI